MKFIHVVLTLLVLVSAQLEIPDINKIEPQRTININNFVDRFIPYISRFIVNNGLDPLELSSAVLKFWMLLPTIPPIKYRAYLTLHPGILKYLSNVKRHGDATLSYQDKIVKMDAGLEFELLQGMYDYTLKLFIFKQEGRIKAVTEDVHAKFSVVFNTTDYTLDLNEFELQTSGRIVVAVESKTGWLDWIITPIVNAVIPLFKDTITGAVQAEAADAIRNFFDEINRKIPPREALEYLLEHELLKSGWITDVNF